MQKKKFMAIPILLIFALVITGFAYAHWEKIVTINGTVETGTVHLEVLSVSSDDPPGAIDPGKDKDVGCTTATYDPVENKITVTITNAYPSYYVYVHFTVHNDGTIPVKLKAIEVDAPPELEVGAWNGIGEQIDPCEKKDNTIYVHVKQEAAPGSTYTFTVEFVYWNWNEV